MTGSPSPPQVRTEMARAAKGTITRILGTGVPEPGRSHRRGDTAPPEPPSGRKGKITISEWPLQTFMELGALPGAVPCARLHVRAMLWEWAVASELREDSEQVISELVGNAVSASRAAGKAAIRLWLLSDRTQILILVGDVSTQRPTRTDADTEAESGRGLLLVEALSAQWGWYFPDDGTPGKVTWALMRMDG